MSAHVCECVLMLILVCVHTCEHIEARDRMIGIFLHESISTLFREPVSLTEPLNPLFADWPNWLASDLWGPPCPQPVSTRAPCTATPGFVWWCLNPNSVLMLAGTLPTETSSHSQESFNLGQSKRCRPLISVLRKQRQGDLCEL